VNQNLSVSFLALDRILFLVVLLMLYVGALQHCSLLPFQLRLALERVFLLSFLVPPFL